MQKFDLLLIGACIAGALLASHSLLQRQSILPGESTSIATVNQVEISAPLYQRVIDGMQNQKKTPLTEQDLRFVRDKLIDEELLIQRGVELGFLQMHAGVRREMLQAVIETVVAEKRSQSIDEKILKDYFEKNKNYFSQTSQLKVRRLQFDNLNDAEAALFALNSSQSFEAIENSYPQNFVFKLPEVMLTPTQLRQYLSAETIKKLLLMESEQYSDVLGENQYWFIYQVLEKNQHEMPELAQVRLQVEAAFLREQEEKSLYDYLSWLKRRADISVQGNAQLKRFLSEQE